MTRGQRRLKSREDPSNTTASASPAPLRVILRPVSSVISPKSCRVCAAIRGATAATLMPATLEPEPFAKHRVRRRRVSAGAAMQLLPTRIRRTQECSRHGRFWRGTFVWGPARPAVGASASGRQRVALARAARAHRTDARRIAPDYCCLATWLAAIKGFITSTPSRIG